MLEKIQKMAENLQPTDFENSNVDAAIIIVAKENKMTIVGGGNVLAQAKAIIRIVEENPMLQLAIAALKHNDEQRCYNHARPHGSGGGHCRQRQ